MHEKLYVLACAEHLKLFITCLVFIKEDQERGMTLYSLHQTDLEIKCIKPIVKLPVQRERDHMIWTNLHHFGALFEQILIVQFLCI